MSTLSKENKNKIIGKGFEFFKNSHEYYLNGRLLTGITTILKIIGGEKNDKLIQWAANMSCDYILRKGITKDEDFILISKNEIEEARKAYLRIRDDAANKGTDIHTELENIIKGAIKNFNGFIQDFFEENKQINNFVNWAIKNKIQFLESEKKMYSEKYWLGGTCDFTAIINGKKYVGDIKTTSGIYDRTPMMQIAAYRMMLEELGEKDFTGSLIVNIKKDGSFDEGKNVYWSEDYEQDLRGFFAALELYRVLNNTIINK